MKFGTKLAILLKNDEPVYNEMYLKTKIKSYEAKINTSFYNNKMPKEGSHCIWLSVILIDFVFRIGRNIILKCFKKNVNAFFKKIID